MVCGAGAAAVAALAVGAASGCPPLMMPSGTTAETWESARSRCSMDGEMVAAIAFTRLNRCVWRGVHGLKLAHDAGLAAHRRGGAGRRCGRADRRGPVLGTHEDEDVLVGALC